MLNVVEDKKDFKNLSDESFWGRKTVECIKLKILHYQWKIYSNEKSQSSELHKKIINV